jgi:general secretion pathway protein B
MSFILDALKKSESARQRQAGPGLFEVKVVPPRRALPAWAVMIGVLLAINAVVLAWLMLRHPAASPAPPAVAARTAVAASPAPATPSAAAPRTGARLVSATATPDSASTAISAAALIGTSGQPSLAAPEPPAPALAARPSSQPGSTGSLTLAGLPNPADLAPAISPPASGGDAAAGARGALPLYAQIVAQSGSDLPHLHMDLHVYDPNPSKRYVMINMHILHTGDSLPDGVTVVAIRPDGVALSYRGREFLLPR